MIYHVVAENSFWTTGERFLSYNETIHIEFNSY